MIKTKSVYTPIERQRDGIRILATRFRGRGLRKSRYDVWMPNLGPSERLLHSYHAQKLTWAKFSQQYRSFSMHGLNLVVENLKWNRGQFCCRSGSIQFRS
jgi:uncharacterized protein YeaO (DUF488 family)